MSLLEWAAKTWHDELNDATMSAALLPPGAASAGNATHPASIAVAPNFSIRSTGCALIGDPPGRSCARKHPPRDAPGQRAHVLPSGRSCAKGGTGVPSGLFVGALPQNFGRKFYFLAPFGRLICAASVDGRGAHGDEQPKNRFHCRRRSFRRRTRVPGAVLPRDAGRHRTRLRGRAAPLAGPQEPHGRALYSLHADSRVRGEASRPRPARPHLPPSPG